MPNEIQTAMSVIDFTVKQLESWNKIRKNTGNVLRLLYLEICANLEILTVCKKDVPVIWNKNNTGIEFFIINLKTDFIKMVLCGNENKHIYNLLEKTIEKHLGLESEVANTIETENAVKTILESLRFIYTKIDFLKILLERKYDSKNICDIRIKVRLSNIGKQLVFVKCQMAKIKYIKTIK